MPELPFSQACENNKEPILQILKPLLAASTRVLEIGSGTGQHAVHFAPALPQVRWQCSDLPHNLPGVASWIAAYPSPNLLTPQPLDMRDPAWPDAFDVIYSANTAHIMPWPLVQRMLRDGGQLLPNMGLLVLYGPFNYGGEYTSASNAAFDTWLKQQDEQRGIRDFEAVDAELQAAGLALEADHAMPANNRLVVWRKPAL